MPGIPKRSVNPMIHAKDFVDSVQFVSKHITSMPSSVREKLIKSCLDEFHQEDTSEERKKELSDTIVMQTWLLFPYILSRKHFQAGVFEEALQNMVISTMKAIDKFDVDRGSKFTSYITGYLKDALSISLKSTYVVVSPASVRRKQLEELCEREKEALLNQLDPSSEEMSEQTQTVGSSSINTGNGGDDETHEVNRKSGLGEISSDFQNYSGMYIDEMDYSNISEYVNDAPIEGELYKRELTDLLVEVLDVQSNQDDLRGMDEEDEYTRKKRIAKNKDEICNLLTYKEKLVIIYRYGFTRAAETAQLTLEEIATMFNANGWPASKAWIYQIEQRAKEKLKKYLIERGVQNSYSY